MPATFTLDKLPAVDCATWCADGTGHTDAGHPDEQGCTSHARRVTLLRHEPVGSASGGWQMDSLAAHVARDRFEDASVQLNHDIFSVASMTPAEARELAAALSASADAAESV
jgi:hypothetical protein